MNVKCYPGMDTFLHGACHGNLFKLGLLLRRKLAPDRHESPALLKPLAEIGDVLVSDERVRMITFTGSSGVGWGLAERAPQKRVRLELGNSTPVMNSAFVEGAPSANLYVILSGSAIVRKNGRRIARLGPGDVVGELSVILDGNGEPEVVAAMDRVLAAVP